MTKKIKTQDQLIFKSETLVGHKQIAAAIPNLLCVMRPIKRVRPKQGAFKEEAGNRDDQNKALSQNSAPPFPSKFVNFW